MLDGVEALKVWWIYTGEMEAGRVHGSLVGHTVAELCAPRFVPTRNKLDGPPGMGISGHYFGSGRIPK